MEAHPSVYLILGVLTYLLATNLLPDLSGGWSTITYWAVGCASAVLLFVTVLIHELAHAVVAIRRGLPVERITLFIFGGVSHLSQQPRSAGEEFAIAVAGPIASLVLAFASFGFSYLMRSVNVQLEAMFTYLAAVNLLIALFNMVPGFPLDGGRVLRSIVWRTNRSFPRATRFASGAGQVAAWGLIATGLFFLFRGDWLMAIWAGMLGWFLLSAGHAEVDGVRLDLLLSRLRARDLMPPAFVRVIPGASISSVASDYLAGEDDRATSMVVANGDQVLGVVSVRDFSRIPAEEWGMTSVQRVMTPRKEVEVIAADAPASNVVPLMLERRLHHVPVLEEGRLIGLIIRDDFFRRLEAAEAVARHHDDDPDSDSDPDDAPTPPPSPSDEDRPSTN